MHSDTAEGLLREIQVAAAEDRGSKDLIGLARRLEELSLEGESVLPDAFTVYEAVLKDPCLCSKRGADEFVAGLFTDFERLSPAQQERLSALFLEGSRHYSLPILRIAIGDLIARKYGAAVAMEAFSRMWCSGDEYAREIAYSGAQVLSRILPNEGSDRAALHRLGELMNRQP